MAWAAMLRPLLPRRPDFRALAAKEKRLLKVPCISLALPGAHSLSFLKKNRNPNPTAAEISGCRRCGARLEPPLGALGRPRRPLRLGPRNRSEGTYNDVAVRLLLRTRANSGEPSPSFSSTSASIEYAHATKVTRGSSPSLFPLAAPPRTPPSQSRFSAAVELNAGVAPATPRHLVLSTGKPASRRSFCENESCGKAGNRRRRRVLCRR